VEVEADGGGGSWDDDGGAGRTIDVEYREVR